MEKNEQRIQLIADLIDLLIAACGLDVVEYGVLRGIRQHRERHPDPK